MTIKTPSYIDETRLEEYLKPIVDTLDDFSRDTFSYDRILRKAQDLTERETDQALEALVHNLCSMQSRCGSQTPFSSVNFGTDTSWEGRTISWSLLKAIDKGLGHGEVAIFPISIFKMKKGITDKGSPNYDLYHRSCEVSARRLFPNWVNLDAPYNLQYYKPEDPNTQAATMGCRTRAISNTYNPEKEIYPGRGNLFWTTINLPYIALEAKESMKGQEPEIVFETFLKRLEEVMDDVIDFSYDRFNIIARTKAHSYPFSMGQHEYVGSESLKPNDPIESVIKNGSITVGFIGLAETLIALFGKHHAEDEYAQRKGLEIIRFMRERTDREAKRAHLNFSLMASPAEGCTGRLRNCIQKRFGDIPRITDKKYLVNSSHRQMCLTAAM